jgi:hypothetical protein
MSALLLGAAAAYLAAGLAYFRGRFAPAAALGALYVALMAPATTGALGAAFGLVLFLLLALAPAGYLVVHYVDARKGLFLLPTIYSIPLAFVCGLVLWLVTALAAILR